MSKSSQEHKKLNKRGHEGRIMSIRESEVDYEGKEYGRPGINGTEKRAKRFVKTSILINLN